MMQLPLAGPVLLLLCLPLSFGQERPYATTLKGLVITRPSGAELVPLNDNYRVSWDYDSLEDEGLIDLDLVIGTPEGKFIANYFIGTAKLKDKSIAFDPKAGWPKDADFRLQDNVKWQISISTLKAGSNVYTPPFKLIDLKALEAAFKAASTSKPSQPDPTSIPDDQLGLQTDANATDVPNPSKNSASDGASKGGLSKAGEIGIGIGIAFVGLLLLAIVVFLIRRRRRDGPHEDEQRIEVGTQSSGSHMGTTVSTLIGRGFEGGKLKYDQVGDRDPSQWATPTDGFSSYDFERSRAGHDSAGSTLRNETMMRHSKPQKDKTTEWHELSAHGRETIIEMPERNTMSVPRKDVDSEGSDLGNPDRRGFI